MTTPTDHTEYEAKFYPVDKEALRKKLTSLGAKLVVPERKMRRAIIDHRPNPQFKCHYIRVRDEGNLVRLSAKTHASKEGQLSDQKEIDVVVSSYDDTVAILELMGFSFDAYQETLRETWELDGTEVTIDTWPGLETYSEIEAGSEQEVKAVAQKLGFDWENKIITSVVEIFGKKYGLTNDQVHAKLRHVTFDDIPFDTAAHK